METLDKIMSDRDAPDSAKDAAALEISDADRAANPLGSAKAERDHQGRFAPKAEKKDDTKPDASQPNAEANADSATADQQPDQQRRPGTVPQQALEAERRKRQERDDQIAELLRQNAALLQRQGQPPPSPQAQQPTAAPQFWEDPDKATEHRLKSALDPVSQQVQNLTLHFSQRSATQEHGAETVNAAIQALSSLRQSNPGEYQRLEALASQSMDPVGDVVRWHKQQATMQKLQGKDIDSFIKEEVERRLAEMQGGAQHDPQQHQQPAAARQPLPTSFAAQRSGAPRGGQGYGGPRPLSEIMPRG